MNSLFVFIFSPFVSWQVDFKFSNSTSTQVLEEYAAEERRKKFVDGGAVVLADLEDTELKKICSPSVKNITCAYAECFRFAKWPRIHPLFVFFLLISRCLGVYPSVMKLCEAIEGSATMGGKTCVLSIYINRFVADTYLPFLESVVLDKIRLLSRGERTGSVFRFVSAYDKVRLFPSIDPLIDWLVDVMFDWLVDWLTYWFVKWSIDWLIDAVCDFRCIPHSFSCFFCCALPVFRAWSADETMKLATPSALKSVQEPHVKVLLNYYQAHRQIHDLCDLMYTMRLHTGRILGIVVKSVEEFRVGVVAAYERVCACLPGKETPESVRWADDEQFCLFYRALPGWYYRAPSTERQPVVESAATEYETLQKMYDNSLAEIMTDSKVLRAVVLVMENCEWFAKVPHVDTCVFLYFFSKKEKRRTKIFEKYSRVKRRSLHEISWRKLPCAKLQRTISCAWVSATFPTIFSYSPEQTKLFFQIFKNFSIWKIDLPLFWSCVSHRMWRRLQRACCSHRMWRRLQRSSCSHRMWRRLQRSYCSRLLFLPS